MSIVRRAALTRESVLDGISKGDKTFTHLARRHGHTGNVSSTFTANVRKLVPDVAERLAGKVTTVVATAVATPIEQVAQVGQPQVVLQAVPQTVPVVILPVVPPTVLQEQPQVVPPVVPQRRTPYRGMYGAVYARAVKAGEVLVKEFIPAAAADIIADPACAKDVARLQARAGDQDLVGQVTKAINFAIQVLRAPKHRSNLGRSMNASGKRGLMHLVPME